MTDDGDENSGASEQATSGELTVDEAMGDLEFARRMAFMVRQAEVALGLKPDDRRPLNDRLDHILAAALAGRLDPGLYSLCWLLRSVPGR
jgi:hypothetical protein